MSQVSFFLCGPFVAKALQFMANWNRVFTASNSAGFSAGVKNSLLLTRHFPCNPFFPSRKILIILIIYTKIVSCKPLEIFFFFRFFLTPFWNFSGHLHIHDVWKTHYLGYIPASWTSYEFSSLVPKADKNKPRIHAFLQLTVWLGHSHKSYRITESVALLPFNAVKLISLRRKHLFAVALLQKIVLKASWIK